MTAHALGPEVPRAPLPDGVFAVLQEALASFTFHDQTQAPRLQAVQLRATNEAALNLLRHRSWPDFAKLQRICYHDPGRGAESNLLHGRWWVPDPGEQLVWLTDGLDPEWQIRSRFAAFERADYKAELAELLDVLKNPKAVKPRTWSWWGISMVHYEMIPWWIIWPIVG